jgi:DNA-binding XRE family transcriptional regulator
MTETSELTKRVKIAREALNITQSGFAGPLNIFGASNFKLKKGKYKPNHNFLYNIGKELNLDLYYLLYCEEVLKKIQFK